MVSFYFPEYKRIYALGEFDICLNIELLQFPTLQVHMVRFIVQIGMALKLL
ncbi:unnamed protein product [Camellia sinensis]